MLEKDERIYIGLTNNPVYKNTDIRSTLGSGLTETDIRTFLRKAGTEGMLDSILSSDGSTPYQKAVAASQLTTKHFDNSPYSVRKTPDISFDIGILNPETWYLCTTSEKRLKDAFDDGAVTVIEPGLAVKFIGRFTALCFESFATSGGTFIANNWYSPVDQSLRGLLEASFDNGVRRMNVSGGTWALMRQYAEDVDPELIDKIAKIPEKVTLQNFGESWKSYREKRREQFS